MSLLLVVVPLLLLLSVLSLILLLLLYGVGYGGWLIISRFNYEVYAIKCYSEYYEMHDVKSRRKKYKW